MTKSVIFFQYPWRFWRERLSGIYRYAEKADWQVQVLEFGRTVLSVRKALAFWRPDGCIVEGGYTELRGFRQSDFDCVPTVFCDANKTKMTGPYSGVVHDSVVTPPSLVRFEVSHIVRRNSTTKFTRRDDSVRDALALIREHACAPLSSAEVCARIGGSRRQAECRFRKLVGHSIGEEIRSVRIARAKDLLLRRNIPIESIFADCGYTSDASLRRAFRKATGCSLRDWRTRANQ